MDAVALTCVVSSITPMEVPMAEMEVVEDISSFAATEIIGHFCTCARIVMLLQDMAVMVLRTRVVVRMAKIRLSRFLVVL